MEATTYIRQGEGFPSHTYGVYLVLAFEGLSLRAASRALRTLATRSHVSTWRWV
ncbi:MAG: hypothetical protein QW057_03300 [Candidatus Bathyarchaeia archaeon]